MAEREKNGLIISAHADDHMMFAGTVMYYSQKHGVKFREVVLTDTSVGPDYREQQVEHSGITVLRNGELDKATRFLGIEEVFPQFEPDFFLQFSPQRATKIAKIIQKFRPDLVILPGTLDKHDDHLAASKIGESAVWRAAGNFPSQDIDMDLSNPHRVPIVLAAEMMIPDRVGIIYDISEFIERKRQLFDIYASQASPRLKCYVNGLADARGYGLDKNEREVARAEGFNSLFRLPIIANGSDISPLLP